MINLLRGEFYKLVRAKSLYICGVMIMVFVVLFYGMFTMVDIMHQEEVEESSLGAISIEIETDTQEYVSIWEETELSSMAELMFADVGLVILAIFASIFVYGEYAGGAIKNVVGKGYGRWTVFGAKYISTVVGCAILEIFMVLALILCEVLFVDINRLTGDALLWLCGYTGVQLVLGAALTGIIVLISQLCRNLGTGIAISICLLMFSSFITMGLNALLSYFKLEVNVCDYWIVDLISNCSEESMNTDFLPRAIICAVIWFVAALIFGGIHFRKADVK